MVKSKIIFPLDPLPGSQATFTFFFIFAELIKKNKYSFSIDIFFTFPLLFLQKSLKDITKNVVQSGTYKEMKIGEIAWSEYDYCPKILGFYEEEVQKESPRYPENLDNSVMFVADNEEDRVDVTQDTEEKMSNKWDKKEKHMDEEYEDDSER